ncbi:hypothetical protein N2W54_002295 [Lotmaria passim]
MLEQSIVSRSPSGQWYPQQQQQPHVPPQSYGNVVPGHPPMSPQWSPASGTTTPVTSPAGPNANAGVNLGNSGTFNSVNANYWNTNPGAGLAGGGVGGPQDSLGRSSLPGGALSPQQQQMMMQQGLMYGQNQCCASCCGPTSACCGPAGGCCGPTGNCCGPTGGCCGPSGGCCGPTGGCCPMPGEPIDPFCCTPPVPGQQPPCYVTVYNCFDWTFLLACLLFVLTVVGFGVVVGTKSKDDIFKKFNVRTTAELDAAIRPYIVWMNVNATNSSTDNSTSNSSGNESVSSAVHHLTAVAAAAMLAKLSDATNAVVSAAKKATVTEAVITPARYNMTHNCTHRKLLGSFGVICMEDNLYANTFAVQLSSWTNARDTLWFLAMVYSGFTLIYAVLINVQRHPAAGTTLGAGGAALPTITPQEQEEFTKMTPQQQQAFIQDYQQRVAAVQQQNPNANYPQPPGAGCCGSDSGIEFYDTPFYEFVRIAWFVSGLTAFVWTCNLFLSFWAFSDFYIHHTSGRLHTFWVDYARKMNGSLVMVTIFLAWPLCNFVLEVVLWLIGVLPWLVIRSTCKRGIEMYRPALPLSQLPMYIRADMYFMDFQDVKRLGFSRQAWMMLTGSDRPFFEGCEDPTVDKDPAMTQLMQMRLQWQQSMMAMMPPWMQQAGGAPGMLMMGPNGQMTMNYQQQQQMTLMGGVNGSNPNNRGGTPSSQGGTPATVATNGAVLPTSTPAATPAEYPIEENEAKTHRRRRHGTHEHHHHADPASAAAGASNNAAGMEQTSLGLSNVNVANSTRHRRHHSSKSRSRSKAAFESGQATPFPPGTDAAVAAAPAGGNSPSGATTRHRRHHSRSREKAAVAAAGGGGGGASPVPVPAPPGRAAGGDENAASPAGEGGGHHRHSRSRSRSKAAGAADAAAATPGADTQHRHRRHSHSRSRSREKLAKKDAATADLDALMQL